MDGSLSSWRDGGDFTLPHMKQEENNGEERPHWNAANVDRKPYKPYKYFDDLDGFIVDDKARMALIYSFNLIYLINLINQARMKHLKKALKKDKLGMPCEVCAEWCMNKEALGKHMLAAHPGGELGRSYECTFCDRAYKSSAQMNIHRDVERDDLFQQLTFKESKPRLLLETKRQTSFIYT